MGNKRRFGNKKFGNKRRRGDNDTVAAEAGAGASSSGEWDRSNGDFGKWILENAAFETFYQNQPGLIPDGEWDAFLAALRRQLPTAFRVNESAPSAEHIRERLTTYFRPRLDGLEIEGEKYPGPAPIPWYPGQMGWQLPVWKATLRKNPAFREFHEFLKTETALGTISRQEAVSMLPAFFLKVESHHRVLDTCAAPGSKTAQLLEFMDQNRTQSEELTGLLIANDFDVKRAYLLVHQVQRLRDLYPNIILTNHDAQQYPNIMLPNDDGTTSPLVFDRILCDVMCSGDGTIRKSPDMWRRWTPRIGQSLHPMQIRVTLRAAQMLAPGGRLVYSTCSLSPIEDEAVVAEVLRRTGGALELVDCSQDLPDLVRQAGLYTWKVMDSRRCMYNTLEEYNQSDKIDGNYTPGVFPPSLEVAQAMHLERCMRILPHSQDSGGFFVAVFQRTGKPLIVDDSYTYAGVSMNASASAEKLASPSEDASSSGAGLSSPAETPSDAPEDAAKKQDKKPEKIRQWAGHGTDDAPFIPADATTVDVVKRYYGVDDAKFPTNQFYIRQTNSADAANLLFVSPSVKRILDANMTQRKLRIVNTGLKTFEKREAPFVVCKYRVSQECLGIFVPHITKHKFYMSMHDFNMLLSWRNVPIAEFTDVDFREQMYSLEPGGCVLVLKPALDLPFYSKLHASKFFSVVAFRSRGALNLFVSKNETDPFRANVATFFPELATPVPMPENRPVKVDDDAAGEPSTSGAGEEGDAKGDEYEVTSDGPGADGDDADNE
nr:RNA cytosine C(5)-methyltransferase [Seculamonas ecuadoriensis]